MKKERIAKRKITEKKALDLLENYVEGRIKPKDKEERNLLNKLLSAALERLAQPEEKKAGLPVPREISLTPEEIKDIRAFKPPAKRYLELPLIIVNSPELTEYQEGKNGSLINEFYKKGTPFIESPKGPLTHLGKIMFYGILPNLKRNYQEKGITKWSDYDIIKKGNLKKGGSTYKEIEEESHKIANMTLSHPSIITDETGKGKTLYRKRSTPLFIYREIIKETGRKEKDRLLIDNPILNGSILDQLKTGYHLDNILKARNKHELSIYIFLKPRLKPGKRYFPIAEDKLFRYAGIHTKEKYNQRRDLKTALEDLERDYQIICEEKNKIYFFYLLEDRPYIKGELQAIRNLLKQGKTLNRKEILKQGEADQREEERTKREEASQTKRKIYMQTELYKWGISTENIKEITEHHPIGYLEKMLKKAKNKNPENPAGLFLYIIKNY